MSGISKGKARKARQREEAKRMAALAMERAAAQLAIREGIAAKLAAAGEAATPSTPMAAAMLAAVER